MDQPIIDRLTATKSISRQTGVILQAEYSNPKQVEFKGALDLVTDYDTRSKAYILDRLASLIPTDAVHGEATRPLYPAGRSEFEWHVDPLDGTHGL